MSLGLFMPGGQVGRWPASCDCDSAGSCEDAEPDQHCGCHDGCGCGTPRPPDSGLDRWMPGELADGLGVEPRPSLVSGAALDGPRWQGRSIFAGRSPLFPMWERGLDLEQMLPSAVARSEGGAVAEFVPVGVRAELEPFDLRVDGPRGCPIGQKQCSVSAPLSEMANAWYALGGLTAALVEDLYTELAKEWCPTGECEGHRDSTGRYDDCTYRHSNISLGVYDGHERTPSPGGGGLAQGYVYTWTCCCVHTKSDGGAFMPPGPGEGGDPHGTLGQ